MAVFSSTTKKQNAARRRALWSFGGVDKSLLLLISCLGLLLAGLAALDTGLTGLALVGLGLLLGMAFMGFQYGFASGWRRFLETGDASALSLHFLLAALCALMFIPVSAAGLGPSGSLAPVSVSLFIGAFIFGTGMQLANGCGSGVLFSFGGGSGPDDCGLAIFCFWIRAGVDHSAALIGMGVAWPGRNRRGPVRYR